MDGTVPDNNNFNLDDEITIDNVQNSNVARNFTDVPKVKNKNPGNICKTWLDSYLNDMEDLDTIINDIISRETTKNKIKQDDFNQRILQYINDKNELNNQTGKPDIIQKNVLIYFKMRNFFEFCDENNLQSIVKTFNQEDYNSDEYSLFQKFDKIKPQFQTKFTDFLKYYFSYKDKQADERIKKSNLYNMFSPENDFSVSDSQEAFLQNTNTKTIEIRAPTIFIDIEEDYNVPQLKFNSIQKTYKNRDELKGIILSAIQTSGNNTNITDLIKKIYETNTELDRQIKLQICIADAVDLLHDTERNYAFMRLAFEKLLENNGYTEADIIYFFEKYNSVVTKSNGVGVNQHKISTIRYEALNNIIDLINRETTNSLLKSFLNNLKEPSILLTHEEAYLELVSKIMIKLDNGESLDNLFYKESGKIIDPIKSIKYYLSLSDEERDSFFRELSLKNITIEQMVIDLNKLINIKGFNLVVQNPLALTNADGASSASGTIQQSNEKIQLYGGMFNYTVLSLPERKGKNNIVYHLIICKDDNGAIISINGFNDSVTIDLITSILVKNDAITEEEAHYRNNKYLNPTQNGFIEGPINNFNHAFFSEEINKYRDISLPFHNKTTNFDKNIFYLSEAGKKTLGDAIFAQGYANKQEFNNIEILFTVDGLVGFTTIVSELYYVVKDKIEREKISSIISSISGISSTNSNSSTNSISGDIEREQPNNVRGMFKLTETWMPRGDGFEIKRGYSNPNYDSISEGIGDKLFWLITIRNIVYVNKYIKIDYDKFNEQNKMFKNLGIEGPEKTDINEIVGKRDFYSNSVENLINYLYNPPDFSKLSEDSTNYDKTFIELLQFEIDTIKFIIQKYLETIDVMYGLSSTKEAFDLISTLPSINFIDIITAKIYINSEVLYNPFYDFLELFDVLNSLYDLNDDNNDSYLNAILYKIRVVPNFNSTYIVFQIFLNTNENLKKNINIIKKFFENQKLCDNGPLFESKGNVWENKNIYYLCEVKYFNTPGLLDEFLTFFNDKSVSSEKNSMDESDNKSVSSEEDLINKSDNNSDSSEEERKKKKNKLLLYQIIEFNNTLEKPQEVNEDEGNEVKEMIEGKEDKEKIIDVKSYLKSQIKKIYLETISNITNKLYFMSTVEKEKTIDDFCGKQSNLLNSEENQVVFATISASADFNPPPVESDNYNDAINNDEDNNNDYENRVYFVSSILKSIEGKYSIKLIAKEDIIDLINEIYEKEKRKKIDIDVLLRNILAFVDESIKHIKSKGVFNNKHSNLFFKVVIIDILNGYLDFDENLANYINYYDKNNLGGKRATTKKRKISKPNKKTIKRKNSKNNKKTIKRKNSKNSKKTIKRKNSKNSKK